MDLSFNLAPSYRDLKDPTSLQNFEDTPGQIPKLILTLRHKRDILKKKLSNFFALYVKSECFCLSDVRPLISEALKHVKCVWS